MVDLWFPSLVFWLCRIVWNKCALGEGQIDRMVGLWSNVSNCNFVLFEFVWRNVSTVGQPVMPARLCMGCVVSPKVLVFDPSCSHVDFGRVVGLVVLIAKVVFSNKSTRLGVVHVGNLTARTTETISPHVLESSEKRDRHN